MFRSETFAQLAGLAGESRSRIARRRLEPGDRQIVRTSCSTGSGRYPFLPSGLKVRTSTPLAGDRAWRGADQ